MITFAVFARDTTFVFLSVFKVDAQQPNNLIDNEIYHSFFNIQTILYLDEGDG